MKIAFVLNSLQDGGIARVGTTYANLIAENYNVEVFVILLHKMPPLFELSKKVNVLENGSLRKGGNKYIYTINTFVFLRKIFKDYKFDRLVINGEWITSFCFFASIWTDVKKIFFFDHSNPLRKKQSPYEFADKYSYSKVDNVLVLSDAAKDVIYDKFPNVNKVSVVENPVIFLNNKGGLDKRNIIISMGRLSPEKGQDILLKSFVKSNHSNWQLHFLGDGPMKKELEDLAIALGVEDSVVFLGNKQNISDFLSLASIYVMPSKTENFPMALLEAMSLGLPCIVTDCMPWRENDDFIINDVNGIKVSVDNIDEMSDALNRLMSSEDERKYFGQMSLQIRDRLNINKALKGFCDAIQI